MDSPFEEFAKIPRLSRNITVTEKIDGTNAQILVDEYDAEPRFQTYLLKAKDGLAIYAGSRSRLITPAADNYGFAAWVTQNADELLKLGPGRHYGEWWGAGIQRRYGLGATAEKRFSLFNTARWIRSEAERTPQPELHENRQRVLPACCHVVPVLYSGIFSEAAINDCLARLRQDGSVAAPGFMDPEGVVIYHEAARMYFKKTLLKDEEPKGKNV